MPTTVTSETFSNTVARLAREHRLYLDDTDAGRAEWRRVFRSLHVAADAAGVSHDDADALLVEEIDAGPVRAN